MEATELTYEPGPRELARERLEEELATLSAHISAATARWLELALGFREEGGGGGVDLARCLAFRCGLTPREANEYLRVAEALEELPHLRSAFARGELTFTKVRALTRVATPASEEGLLELAGALTASQLERALRAYRRVRAQEARTAHELEYLDYYWDEDGSLVLRARLAAEDGTVLVRALEASCEFVRERRREERAKAGDGAQAAREFEPPRPMTVEAAVELAQRALASPPEDCEQRRRLVVHVDVETLADGGGRCELEEGPVISPETARRLGCDAETITVLEKAGLPLSVGRRRRSVPPALRRLLETRDAGRCRFPGCERCRHLDAHHRVHWAHGGETSLQNLVLLCFQHHRLVHEGGFTIEESDEGELRFRNRYGVYVPSVPSSAAGSSDDLVARNERAGLTVTPTTNRNGDGDPFDLSCTVDALLYVAGHT